MNAFLDRMNMRDMLAFVLVLAFMSMAFLLAVRAPESDIFKMLLGGLLSTGFAGVIAWYFGSSSGSAMKDEALAKTATAQTETIAKTAMAQTDTIAAQGAALAAAPPPTVTTTVTDPGPPPLTTTTTSPAPAQPDDKEKK